MGADSIAAVPDTPRYRCSACGNLTRFDVTTTRRTTAFHHYTVGGELEVEDVQVLSEQVEGVSCRWCGTGTAVVPMTDEEITVESVASATAASEVAPGEVAAGEVAAGEVAPGEGSS